MDGSPIRNTCIAALIVFSFLLSSCGQALNSTKQAAPSITEVVNIPPASSGEVVDVLGFFVRMVAPSDKPDLSVKLHKTARQYGATLTYPVADLATELTSECKVPLGTTGAAADITCILEIEELDLFFNELTMQVHIPSTACDYLGEVPYYFYAYEPGSGPTTTSHEVLADGTINDVLNTSNGIPQCRFDYTSIDGPDCCIGDYTKIVTTYEDNGSSDTSSTSASWTGKVSSCLTGPAMSTQPKSGNGAPMRLLTYVRGTGVNKTYTVPAAINQSIGSTAASSNFYAASFYEPGSHGGLVTSKPLAFDTQTNVPALLRISAHDHYEFQCLNRAEDLNARIRIHIREWNRDNIGSTTDPDETGAEPDFPDKPYNDRYDWLDLENLGFGYPSYLI